MRIILIRHAEPDYVLDSLTEKGVREAELLRGRLQGYAFRDCYVSPLGRARETAEIAMMGRNAKIEEMPWLAEFRGRFPDRETGKLRLAWDLPPRVWTAEPMLLDKEKWADAPIFAGGNVREIWDETKAGVDEMMGRYGFVKDGPIWRGEQNTGDTLALFCHFAISMVVTGYLMDLSPMALLQRCFCAPSSVTELVTEERIRGEASFRMTKLGDVSHLESAGEPRSMAGLFPECYTGVDSTNQKINGCRQLWP